MSTMRIRTLAIAPSDGTIVLNNNLRYEHYENPNLGYRTFGWSDNYYVNLSQKLPWKLLLYLSSALLPQGGPLNSEDSC